MRRELKCQHGLPADLFPLRLPNPERNQRYENVKAGNGARLFTTMTPKTIPKNTAVPVPGFRSQNEDLCQTNSGYGRSKNVIKLNDNEREDDGNFGNRVEDQLVPARPCRPVYTSLLSLAY
jgi:hypothetical protein